MALIHFNEKKLFNRYEIESQLGNGSFGEIYLVKTGNEVYVAKIEKIKSKKNCHLPSEAKILQQLQGPLGIPTLYKFGKEDSYYVLVMDLLGPNLEELFNMCNRRFSLKTVLMLADQLLQRIEYLHSKHFVYRDIKPHNFVMGMGRKSVIVHMIDFGLSKRYKNDDLHIQYQENKQLTGTARFASINAHLGIEQSRRDDLEALGYMLIYFLKGYLPWQGFKAETQLEKLHRIMETKMSLPPEQLCKSLPIQFSTYLQYCRTLIFSERPDYSYLRNLFKELFLEYNYDWDYMFDWCLPISKQERERQYKNGNTIIVASYTYVPTINNESSPRSLYTESVYRRFNLFILLDILNQRQKQYNHKRKDLKQYNIQRIELQVILYSIDQEDRRYLRLQLHYFINVQQRIKRLDPSFVIRILKDKQCIKQIFLLNYLEDQVNILVER